MSEKKRVEPVLKFARPADWQAWLKSHGGQPQGVLLRIAKKGATTSITYAERSTSRSPGVGSTA